MTSAFGPFLLGHHTHTGPRETNQDTVLSIELPDGRWLLAVADGMGGLEDGELASKTALGALYRALSEGAGLEEAVGAANTAVHKEAKGRVMGTTLVAALLSGQQAEIVNVGDSRAFLSDALGLVQITRDHTMAEEAAREDFVPMEFSESTSARWAGALARYLGAGEEVETDRFGPLDLVEGAWLVLCSDGLHGVMSSDEIDGFLVGRADAEAAAEGLVEEALARNTGDNVSVVIAFRPGPPETAGPQTFPRPKERTWRPEKILIRSPSTNPEKKNVVRIGTIFFFVVLSMIALVFLLDWILSR